MIVEFAYMQEYSRYDCSLSPEARNDFVSEEAHDKAHEEHEHVGEADDRRREATLLCDYAEVSRKPVRA